MLEAEGQNAGPFTKALEEPLLFLPPNQLLSKSEGQSGRPVIGKLAGSEQVAGGSKGIQKFFFRRLRDKFTPPERNGMPSQGQSQPVRLGRMKGDFVGKQLSGTADGKTAHPQPL